MASDPDPELPGAVSHHGSKYPATATHRQPHHEPKSSARDRDEKKVTLKSSKKAKEKSLPASTRSSTVNCDTRLSNLEEMLLSFELSNIARLLRVTIN